MRDPRAFGRKLKRLLASRAAYAVLDRDLRNGTWLSGGCWAAAKALHQWLRQHGENVHLNAVWGGDVQHHVVVHLRARDGHDWYLDADGASREAKLLDRWDRLERVRNAEIGSFVEEYAEGDIPCPARTVSGLLRLFDERLTEAL